jgi:hypothetical protein
MPICVSAGKTNNNTKSKVFLYLYPQQDILDLEVEKGSYRIREYPQKTELESKYKTARTDKQRLEIKNKILRIRLVESKKWYKLTLNACIDKRYRQQGYNVFFALLDGTRISDVVDIKQNDKIIYVGMDAKTHRTQRQDGSYLYPDNDRILVQLGNVWKLTVSGFHMWDCVEKVAKAAHDKGIDTLVDEDLTEFLVHNINNPNFVLNKYQMADLSKLNESEKRAFLKAREGKPWLLRDIIRE